jgi:protocatechuate 3,4-dioxygenase beta subunit
MRARLALRVVAGRGWVMAGFRFLWMAGWAAAAWAAAPSATAQDWLVWPSPDTLRSSISIVSEREPGKRMIVSGRLLALDGKTARAGVVIGVYQTDARGYYGQSSVSSRLARLHGWLKSDGQGRYEIRTIRPGSYPGTANPAHIHFILRAPGGSERADELRFEDDPLVSLAERERSRQVGRFGGARPVIEDSAGVQRVERDFRVP